MGHGLLLKSETTVLYLFDYMLPSNKHHSTLNQTPQMEAKLSINAALK